MDQIPVRESGEQEKSSDWDSNFNPVCIYIHSKKTLGCFFKPNAGFRPLGKGAGLFLPNFGLKIGLDHNPAVLGWERGCEGEHARHVNIRRHPDDTSARSHHFLSLKEARSVWKMLW